MNSLASYVSIMPSCLCCSIWGLQGRGKSRSTFSAALAADERLRTGPTVAGVKGLAQMLLHCAPAPARPACRKAATCTSHGKNNEPKKTKNITIGRCISCHGSDSDTSHAQLVRHTRSKLSMSCVSCTQMVLIHGQFLGGLRSIPEAFQACK